MSSLSALKLLNKETTRKYEEAQTDLDALTELAGKMRAEISEQKLENDKLLAAASAPTCQTEKRQIDYLKSKVEICEKTLLGSPDTEETSSNSTVDVPSEVRVKPSSLAEANRLITVSEKDSRLFDSLSCENYSQVLTEKSEMLTHSVFSKVGENTWQVAFHPNNTCTKDAFWSKQKGVCFGFTSPIYESNGSDIFLKTDPKAPYKLTKFEKGVAKYSVKRVTGGVETGIVLLCSG